ncbi:hypothetical protein [Burkholderia oklahomensis]|uniref:hypothetical protein n=1 Tax=Burkholderia oklahomensis TaxID=342113 RepID=UPI000A8EC945|nr:hypothetical protein [Burkholderia oklahomensis]MBI0364124.1 hypothetical protein [Burkholderia oklahomensis]QPS41859.1 hypothetical protein I6G57_25705 [Burkholderia oklahomensis]
MRGGVERVFEPAVLARRTKENRASAPAACAARHSAISHSQHAIAAIDAMRTSVPKGVITFRRPFENRGDSESEEAFTTRDNFVTLCGEACDKIKRGDD